MTTGDNLATVCGLWLDGLRQGRTEVIAPLLDEDVIWEGLPGEGVCRSRDQALEVLRERRPSMPHLTRLDAVELGDRVVLSAEGPDLPREAVHLVFTFRDGRIVHWQAAPSRDEALLLAAAPAI